MAQSNAVEADEEFHGHYGIIGKSFTAHAQPLKISHPIEAAHTIDDRKCEQIDGVVYMMASPVIEHAVITNNISAAIKEDLVGHPCFVSMENVDFKYNSDISDDEDYRGDYLLPDIMIMCDRSKVRRGAYYGVPKFVAEVLSPSTSKRDRARKKDIYEAAGVSEYWIVTPMTGLEIYYLDGGKYRLENSYIYCDDKGIEDHNADDIITLREFPNVSMTLRDIFTDTFR